MDHPLLPLLASSPGLLAAGAVVWRTRGLHAQHDADMAKANARLDALERDYADVSAKLTDTLNKVSNTLEQLRDAQASTAQTLARVDERVQFLMRGQS